MATELESSGQQPSSLCYSADLLQRKDQTKVAIREVFNLVTKYDGVVRRVENMGEHALPYRMKRHGHECWRGRYMLMDVLFVPSLVKKLEKELCLEPDIIRHTILKKGNVFAVPREQQEQAKRTAKSLTNKAMRRIYANGATAAATATESSVDAAVAAESSVDAPAPQDSSVDTVASESSVDGAESSVDAPVTAESSVDGAAPQESSVDTPK